MASTLAGEAAGPPRPRPACAAARSASAAACSAVAPLMSAACAAMARTSTALSAARRAWRPRVEVISRARGTNVGVTPEAPTLGEACGGRPPARTIDVGVAELQAVAGQLTSAGGTTLGAVSVGTPHFSLRVFGRLVELRDRHPGVAASDCYVATSRFVAQEDPSDG